MFDIEFRSDSVFITGYVNAVGRDSRPVNTRHGKVIEQIVPGAFAEALRASACVDMLLNHDYGRKLGDTANGVVLREDSIGLRAEAVIYDKEVIDKARNGKLRGWSFGFTSIDDEIENRSEGKLPRRYVKRMNISEVSLIDDRFIPCYEGTSIEVRAENEVEIRAFEDEIRYNPYHDPTDGRFTTANGGGNGSFLFVGKGEKGKGQYVVGKENFASQKEVVNYNGKDYEVYSAVPDGFKRIEDAQEAYGMKWYTNGKSRFSGERKTVLVKDDRFHSVSAAELFEIHDLKVKRHAEDHKHAMENWTEMTRTSTSAKRQTNRDHKAISSFLGYRAEPDYSYYEQVLIDHSLNEYERRLGLPLTDRHSAMKRNREKADDGEEVRFNPYHDDKGRFCSGKGVDKSGESGIIKHEDIYIGHSVGAKSQNYEVIDLTTGEKFKFVEGTHIQDVETFAGKGTHTPYRNAYKYARDFGGKSEDWQHTKGKGVLDYYGEERSAEVHWSQCEGIGKFDFFIKEWLE